MSYLRFSESGKEYLQLHMDARAKNVAVHLLASLLGMTSSHHVIAMAVDKFLPILRMEMETVVKEIDHMIQEHLLVELVKCTEKDGSQPEFSVLLDGFAPDKKISVIKAVREITLLGLKDAKDIVEAAPKAVKENVGSDEAEQLKKKLEAAGGRVSIK